MLKSRLPESQSLSPQALRWQSNPGAIPCVVTMAILQRPRSSQEACWGTINVHPNSLNAFPGARTTMTLNLPGTCPRARWSVTYGDHVPPPPRRFGSGLSLCNRSFPTLPWEELHTKPQLGTRGSMASKWFLIHLQVPALSDFRTQTDGSRLRSVS